MVSLNGIFLPPQTLFSAEHESKTTGVTDVAHTLTGKPVIFAQKKRSKPATLEFNSELAWLDVRQHNALVNFGFDAMTLHVRGVDYVVILNHNASDGAVVLSPIMPFSNWFNGVVNLIILES